MLMRAAVPMMLVVALVLTGCGSSKDESESADKPTAAASQSAPPGVDTTPPARPTGLADTSQSAVQYASWFAQLIQFALEARDSRVVNQEAFDQAACSGCRSLSTFVGQLEDSGYWQVSDALEMGALKAKPRQGDFRVSGSFTYPRVRDLTADGKVARTIPAKPYGYYVDLTWDGAGKTWRVRDYQFQSEK